MPRVSVLMPIFNAAQYLGEAIDSILAQSYDDFEFLLVNDGSTDESSTIIDRYSDSRIKHIKLEENKGVVVALNTGLSLATGEYIVRMDADDIAMPHRIERQVLFMDQDQSVGISGTAVAYFGNRTGVITMPQSHDEIIWTMQLGSPFFHPSVIIRKSILSNHQLRYPGNFSHAEDYALWIELIGLTRFANLTEVLLKYRVSGKSVSSTNRDLQSTITLKLRRKALDILLKRKISEKEWNALNAGYESRLDVQLASDLLDEIIDSNFMNDSIEQKAKLRLKQLIRNRGIQWGSYLWLIKKSFTDRTFFKYLF